MNWFKKLFSRFNKTIEEPDYEEEGDWEDTSSEEGTLDLGNREIREEYENCLEKIADASKELENLTLNIIW